jgi:hypothetical protein
LWDEILTEKMEHFLSEIDKIDALQLWKEIAKKIAKKIAKILTLFQSR